MDRKECFLDNKKKVLKNSKKSIFCKGVSPWFLSINRPFSRIFFFLTKKSQKETFFHILDRKECFLDLESEVLKNSKKLTFCNGVSPWFLSKNRPFSHLFFFLSKKSEKERFFDFLDRKECFLDHKREVLKNSKKSTFCKGVSPWFLCKNRLFSYKTLFEQKRKKEKFFDILDRK